MPVDSKYYPPNPRNPTLKTEDCKDFKCDKPVEKPECEPTCGNFDFDGPATVTSFNALEAYQVFQVTTVDGVETENRVGIFGGASPFTREFKLCGKYRIKYCYSACEPLNEEEPVFLLNDCDDPAEPCKGADKVELCNTDDLAEAIGDAVADATTPDPIDYESQTACLTQNGQQREIVVLRRTDDNSMTTVRYEELNGERINNTTAADRITMGACSLGCDTCRPAVGVV